jgi:hypothetical protein
MEESRLQPFGRWAAQVAATRSVRDERSTGGPTQTEEDGPSHGHR